MKKDNPFLFQNLPVAIIGIGCLFPEAPGLKAFWRLMVHRQDAIRDVPDTHWSADEYFDEDPKKPDHVYCKRGAFLPSISFDPSEFGIPPSSLEATDTSQLLALVTAKAALEDAGYGPGVDFHRDRTSVILGVTGTQELVIPLGARLGHPRWRKALKHAGIANDTAEKIMQDISDSYVPWQENSFPGLLGNVVAGRICNRLNLGGTNCVVDAACASSMGALHLSLLELQSGRSDMVVSGGIDTINDIFMNMCFAKTMILSPTGDIRPFSKYADGTVLGEGVGMVVLKRLGDAEKDGDNIYAVIKGMGSSSDGKSQSIYAPRADGQAKAIQMAYDTACIDPSTIAMIEAHGTGTRVGDQVEFSSLRQVFKPQIMNGEKCALGSIKSMIGHTKAAAGTAGLIKAVLALKNKVFLPTLKAETPDPQLEIETSPFYINSETRPWFSHSRHPRRSGVSSFGFGGSNFHVVLEEYHPQKQCVSWDHSVEIFAVSARHPARLSEKLLELAKGFNGEPTSDNRSCLAAETRRSFDPGRPFRLILVHDQSTEKADHPASLQQLLNHAMAGLQKNSGKTAWHQKNIYYGCNPRPKKLAFLFPGQGSQYIGMGKDITCTFPDMMNLLEKFNRRTPETGGRLTDFIFPTPMNPEERQTRETFLGRTEIAQPAIGGISLAMVRILERFGIRPDAACGHSFGELTALCAAGWMDEDTFIDLSIARGRIMSEAGKTDDRGAMLAVKAPLKDLAEFCSSRPELTLANLNSPEQGVLSGQSGQIERAQKELQQKGFGCIRLSVSAAFHSSLLKSAALTFQHLIDTCRFTPSAIPVLSNATGSAYPADANHVKKILGDQMLSPVQFLSNIEYLHRQGMQTFVEMGPRSILTGLAGAILKTKKYHAMSLDASAGRRFGLADLAGTLAGLASLGYPVELEQWEDPVPEKRKQRMQVPICGSNYRSPKKALPYKAETTADPVPGFPVPVKAVRLPSENQAAAANAVTCKTKAHFVSQKSNETTPSIQPIKQTKMKKQNDTGNSKAFMESALRTFQEGLTAMQALQAQTAEAHKLFLEAQTEAGRTLQRMMESTQRLTEASMGLTVAFPLSEAEKKPKASAGRPAEAGGISPLSTIQPEILLQPPPTAINFGAGNDPTYPAARGSDACQRSESASIQKAGELLDAPGIEKTLLNVVAELTGYPVEMLNLEMDIEADLGIDSIKRVEILSSLEEKLPDLPPVSPDRIGTLKTLGQIVSYLAGNSATGRPAGTDSAASAAGFSCASKAPTVVEKTNIETSLLTVVAELTGYPLEMLNLEMDIEADLGIDSIKRVEILSTLEEKLPDSPPVSPEMMGTLKTLGQISAFLSQKPNTNAALSLPAGAEPTSGGMERSESKPPWVRTFGPEQRLPIERWAVSLAETPLIRGKTIAIPEGKRLYVLEDALGLSASIVQALAAKNIPAELLSENLLPSLVETPNALSDAGGLVIVSNPETGDDDRDDAFLKKAFMLTRQCAPSLMRASKLSGAVFATVTRLDGAFGFSGRTLNHPVTGGLAGLLKTAAIEWKTVACRALDIDPDWNDLQAAAHGIAAEIMFSNQPGPSEIGISPSHRYALELRPLPQETRHARGLNLKAADVVVISGGARGVTAAAAAGLAQNTPATLVLIGRSPFPADEPTWLNGLSEPAEIKRAILENEFNNNGASPRDIERSYQNYMAGREILHTLDTLSTIGATVQYRSMDIRDAEKIESLLNDIRSEFGPIRAVIHGAGVIDDRLIVDKTPDQVNRVLDTKVKGLRSLLKATKNDSLKYLVIFSSVAARFGNIGQADYAMANEALNKIARQEASRRGDCRVVAINWGPWNGGMVSPSLKREFLKNHMELIPMEAGAECMLDEMAAGREHPIEIVIGSDPRHKDAPAQAAAPSSPQEPAPEKDRLSLLFKREIDTKDYPILDAHRLDGKPVVPFALMTEWFGHGALHENPGLVLHGIDDMRILKGIRLEDNKKIIRLFAGKAMKNGRLYEVPVELRDGVLDGVDVIHSRARAILTDSIPEPPPFTFAADNPAEPYSRSIEEIYDKILFHGMPLRGILEIIACSSRGMTAKISSAPLPSQWIREHLRSSWISDPLALDCAVQMATLWCYEETGAVSLPSYCKQYRQYCTKFPENGITAVLEVHDVAPHKMTGDITLLSGDRQVVAQLSGYEAVIDPSLYRAFKPHLA